METNKLFVVVVVVTSLSENIYIERQMPKDIKKSLKKSSSLQSYCDVCGFIRMVMTFYFPFKA